MQGTWEPQLADLLNDLMTVQDQTLEVLRRKRKLLAAADHEGLAAIAPEEQGVIDRMQQCLARRQELLEQAAREGLPAENLRSLARTLPPDERASRLDSTIEVATARARLLQHESLTNWVVVQRSLLHLSQILEIIATGGQLQPTYGRGTPAAASGAMVDKAV